MAAQFDILLALLTATMLGKAQVLQQSGEELSLSEGQVRTRRSFFNGLVDVKYFLHTRENRGTPTVLENNTPDLRGTHYRSNRPTKFIIHGFRSKGDVQWIVDMANALLEVEDLNVFAVDWQKGAKPGLTGLNYLQAKTKCQKVGETIGKFVRQLGQPGNMIHLIGHSLGAHAAGFAGKATGSRGLTVARISGLDPAGPGFRDADAADRLDKNDATFVDVIHTDVHTFGFGIRKTVGHVDFYPNEGWLQPGCKRGLPGCSHGRASDFYIESIRSGCQFMAYRCKDWDTFNWNRGQCDVCDHSHHDSACSVMGYPSIDYPTSQGSMYLVTNMNPTPHCVLPGNRRKRATESESEQCVQSMRSDMRQQIWDLMDSIADLQEMGMQEDFCSMYSNVETTVANITASMSTCGPEDIPVILEYVADGKYDAVVAWAEDKCPKSTSDGACTLQSAMLVIAIQIIAAVAV